MRTFFHFLVSVVLLFTFSSCEKEDTDTIEGQIIDAISNQPIEGVRIKVDATKSPTSMGIINGGRRETVGNAITDKNGYYKSNLKLFNGAERLQIFINENNQKQGYTDGEIDVSLSALNKGGNTTFNRSLNPTAILKIKFINTSPQSNADRFSLLYGCNCESGHTKGILKTEICGSVSESEGIQWVGQDVCGIYTIEAIAEKKAGFSWYVMKNGETKYFKDSVLVKQGVINNYLLNY